MPRTADAEDVGVVFRRNDHPADRVDDLAGSCRRPARFGLRRPPEDLAHFVAGLRPDGRPRPSAGFLEVERSETQSDGRDRRDGHTQVFNSQSNQYAREFRVRGDFAADGKRFPGLAGLPGQSLEHGQHDRVRIYVTNHLPAPTSVHWHGVLLPCGQDGVSGLTQPAIQPGETFRYEFIFPDSGTFMYHPHFDSMTQEGMGMTGMILVHERQPDAAKRPGRVSAAMLVVLRRITPPHAAPLQ